MFVHYHTVIPRRLPEISAVIPDVLVVLDDLGNDSYRAGEKMRIQIGPRSHRSVTAKTVSLRAEAPIEDSKSIRFSLSWEATGTPGLFPKMTAELIFAPIGNDLTHISFRGVYKPPLGVVGSLLDRTILHRVAESSVKDLVDRIVSVLETAADPDQGNPSRGGAG